MNPSEHDHPLTVSSIFRNLECLLEERAPRTAQILLGARWCFGLPKQKHARLVEYSFPLNPEPFEAALEARTGLRIVRHAGESKGALAEHLASGQPALAVVDTFYLPYRPAYRRVHSSRTIIVRPGRQAGDVLVQDTWMPCYDGPLRQKDLERARHSDVPLDLTREPVFSGTPADAEWFSVELVAHPISDSAAWAAELLGTLYQEGSCSRSDARGVYGMGAFRQFREELGPALRDHTDVSRFQRRQAGLLLRAELSSRVYLCAVLRTAARCVGDALLRSEVDSYHRSLRNMESARDVLTKHVNQFRREYGAYILACLDFAFRAEEQLGAILRAYESEAQSSTGALGRLRSVDCAPVAHR